MAVRLILIPISESEPQLVEDAVKYIIFLVDADRLFNTALGMYDFSLVLMVAQHAQKVRQYTRSQHRILNIETGPSRVSPIPSRTPSIGEILSAVQD